MIGLFLQTSTEVSTPLTAKKSKKKDAGEKKTREKQDRQSERHSDFFRAKSKPDLHLEETTVIEIDSE